MSNQCEEDTMPFWTAVVCLFGVTIRIIVSVADWDIFIKSIWKQYYNQCVESTNKVIHHSKLCKKTLIYTPA